MGDFKLKGFTIIEVSLVLAIAGLIFLMIFVALPALQRSSRDTQRKEDVNALVSAIKKYQTNNRGALPTGTDGNEWRTTSLSNYLRNDFSDPSGGSEEGAYKLTVQSCGSSADNNCVDSVSGTTQFPNDYRMYIVTQAKCAGDESVGALGSSNPRKFAVLYKLEGGGIYCEDG